MKISKFEDILSWQKGQSLAVNIYMMSSNWKDFDFRSQIRRASVSISSNIAEGYDRRTIPDFRKFLYISKASCSEVRSLLELAFKLNYITEKQKIELIENTRECSRLIQGFINSLSK